MTEIFKNYGLNLEVHKEVSHLNDAYINTKNTFHIQHTKYHFKLADDNINLSKGN